MEKVPVTALITMEVYDGMLNHYNDSLLDEEYLQYVTDVEDEVYTDYEPYTENVTRQEEDPIDEEPAFVQ